VRRRCQRPAVPPQWLADRGGHYESVKMTDDADPQLDSVVLVAGDRQLSFGTAPARPVPASRLPQNINPWLPRRRTTTTSLIQDGKRTDGTEKGRETPVTSGHSRHQESPRKSALTRDVSS
jgi:hypothetical protein